MPAGLEHGDLVEQHLGVDDDAVADDRGDVAVEHAARDQLEGEGLAVDHERVPGVVAALVAHHEVHLLGEEVGEAPLALVTPLGSDDDRRRHEPASSAGRKDGRRAYPSGLRCPARRMLRGRSCAARRSFHSLPS